jgi:hypothetical protein
MCIADALWLLSNLGLSVCDNWQQPKENLQVTASDDSFWCSSPLSQTPILSSGISSDDNKNWWVGGGEKRRAEHLWTSLDAKSPTSQAGAWRPLSQEPALAWLSPYDNDHITYSPRLLVVHTEALTPNNAALITEKPQLSGAIEAPVGLRDGDVSFVKGTEIN